MTLPTKVNPVLASTAIQGFLNDPDWQAQIAENDWKILRIGELTLMVWLRAKPFSDTAETFALRLTCDYCPVHPPDVRFVNPVSHEYTPGLDQHHVANIQAPYCYVHLDYSYQNPYPYGPQLVCSSMTLGYYFSGHAPTPDQVWQPSRHDIGSTISTVYSALHSPHYYGRHAG